MPYLGDLAHRIDVLTARAAEGDTSPDLGRAMEDLLCDGYAACLQIDSRIRRLDRRRAELMSAGADRHRASLREMEEQRASLERSAAGARRDLGLLRDRFVRVRRAQSALL